MASVTLNGTTYTDDANASTGLAAGGHRTRFVPCLSNFLAECAIQIGLAADEVALAQAEVVNAQAQVTAATAQKVLAQDAAADAGTSAAKASASASAAFDYALLAQGVTDGLRGTSSSSVAVGTGSKSLVTQTEKSFYPGFFIQLFNSSTVKMGGQVTSYNAGTGELVVYVDSSSGSGSYSSWTLSQDAMADTAAVAEETAAIFALIYS